MFLIGRVLLDTLHQEKTRENIQELVNDFQTLKRCMFSQIWQLGIDVSLDWDLINFSTLNSNKIDINFQTIKNFNLLLFFKLQKHTWNDKKKKLFRFEYFFKKKRKGELQKHTWNHDKKKIGDKKYWNFYLMNELIIMLIF